MQRCTTRGIDLGDKKHAVIGLDKDANVILRRWIPDKSEDIEAFFLQNKE